MKRWLSHFVIAGYLGVLGIGIFCHALGFKTTSHPAMYYVVWDMFCGWSAFEVRHHLIAEGESGKYYELAPAPWGEMTPFGSVGRRHYDPHGTFCGRMAANCLKHTEHEPIMRVFLVEETWSKKYNLPEYIWNQRNDQPMQQHTYFHLYRVFAPDGTIVHSNPNWMMSLTSQAVYNNPRLIAEARKSTPFFALDYHNRNFDKYLNDVGGTPTPEHLASPLGN